MMIGAAPPSLGIILETIPSPSPDFLWNSVALASFMRLSLLKGAHAASSSTAWQEIRVPGWADVWWTALRGLKERAFIWIGCRLKELQIPRLRSG
jgi:hypothetical protein